MHFCNRHGVFLPLQVARSTIDVWKLHCMECFDDTTDGEKEADSSVAGNQAGQSMAKFLRILTTPFKRGSRMADEWMRVARYLLPSARLAERIRTSGMLRSNSRLAALLEATAAPEASPKQSGAEVALLQRLRLSLASTAIRNNRIA
jgi:hypothetical protein